VQPHETLDGSEELPNMKPMMELEAGKNVWYQAYVLKETINEAKVRFPREFTCLCLLCAQDSILSTLVFLLVAVDTDTCMHAHTEL
jgi:hypothetical protein